MIKKTSSAKVETQQSGFDQNQSIAESLGEIARMLSDLHANDYRIRAYRTASHTIRDFEQPIADVYEDEGMDGLIAIPTIGVGIAKLIVQHLRIGRMEMLEQLEGWEKAEEAFAPIPGVGAEIAHHIYDHLAITTIPELREIAKEGRLARISGLGQKRVEQIEAYLADLA